jgi:UDP-2,3-diacylglucosamine pyrophosphatase LpxH
VPGLKVSPIVNMEWFVNNYRSKVVTEGIGLHHMVDCIRTTKQLNMVCRAYDISPSTLLIMHGDKLKPSMRQKCLSKIA